MLHRHQLLGRFDVFRAVLGAVLALGVTTVFGNTFGHEFGRSDWSYKPGTNLLESGSGSDGSRRYGWDYRGNLQRETRWAKNPGTTTGPTPGDWLEDRNLTWNSRNELERLSMVRRLERMDTSLYGYGYDESGWRTSKARGVVGLTDTAWRTTERTVWDGVNAIADSGVSDTGWTYHLHLGLMHVAEMRKSGPGTWTPTYVVTDHLGTVQALLDDTGAVRSRYQLDPYGNLESFEGDRTTAYLYTGKPRDGETGWDYFGARYYDSERGSFTGRDPKLQFWTPYSYVGNQPLTGWDPDGMAAWEVDNSWNDDFVSKYHDFSANFAGSYNEKVDCADLLVTNLVSFASQNKLPLNLFGLNASSDKFTSADQYLGAAKGSIYTGNLPDLTHAVSWADAKPGDLMLAKDLTHTMLFMELENNGGGNRVNWYQGNVPAEVPQFRSMPLSKALPWLYEARPREWNFDSFGPKLSSSLDPRFNMVPTP